MHNNSVNRAIKLQFAKTRRDAKSLRSKTVDNISKCLLTNRK